MITPESRLRRREGILKQRASDTLLLFNREGGQYYALDEVGGRAWELLNEDRTISAIALVLATEYDAPLATIEADLVELFEDLARADLVGAAV